MEISHTSRADIVQTEMGKKMISINKELSKQNALQHVCEVAI